jgi:hypothetical protein
MAKDEQENRRPQWSGNVFLLLYYSDVPLFYFFAEAKKSG